MAVSIIQLSISWHIDLNKRVSCLQWPSTNLRETRRKRNAAHHGNIGTDRDYSDREDCAICIDGIWYEWLYTQISNMTRGFAKISRSGWIITPKVYRRVHCFSNGANWPATVQNMQISILCCPIVPYILASWTAQPPTVDYNFRQAVGRVSWPSKITSQQLIDRFTQVVPPTDRQSPVHPIRVKLFCLSFTGKYVAKGGKMRTIDSKRNPWFGAENRLRRNY